MRSIDGVLLWLAAVVPVTMLSSAHAAPSGVEKYAAPGVQVGQLMEGGGAVIVSSLQVLPNHDLLAIAFARQDHAAGLGIKIAGKLAVIGRISKDAGRTWGEAFLILDSPADSSRTVGDPTAVVAGEKVIVIVCMSGPLKPPFEYGDIRFWQVASTDNAATWSTPTEVAIPRARPGVSGRPGVTLSDGTILVPVLVGLHVPNRHQQHVAVRRHSVCERHDAFPRRRGHVGAEHGRVRPVVGNARKLAARR